MNNQKNLFKKEINMIYRQGEIIISKINVLPSNLIKKGNKILAEGETTNHKHEITQGDAELYEYEGTLFLKVESKEVELIHPDHKTIKLPKGNYEITIQKEYVIGDEKYRKVTD